MAPPETGKECFGIERLTFQGVLQTVEDLAIETAPMLRGAIAEALKELLRDAFDRETSHCVLSVAWWNQRGT